MTKKELEQYRSVVAEIRETEEEIKGNTVTDTVSSSDPEFPYTKHAMSVAGLEKSEYNERLIARRRELLWRKRHIEKYVDGIEDSLTRRIFRMRYIEGEVRPSWQWIAFKVGGGNSADGTRMIHNRHFEKK